MGSKRISIRITPELERRLRRRAAQAGKKESTIVREALDAHLTEEAAAGETAYDVALRAGLIGCVKLAPADLSTNARHFKGFGE